MRPAVRALLLAGQAAAPALSASVAPASRAWAGEAGDWITSAFVCTANNAVGSPTYVWEVVDNAGFEVIIDNETGSSTTLSSTEATKPAGATVRCTVTDNNGSAISNTVSTT